MTLKYKIGPAKTVDGRDAYVMDVYGGYIYFRYKSSHEAPCLKVSSCDLEVAEKRIIPNNTSEKKKACAFIHEIDTFGFTGDVVFAVKDSVVYKNYLKNNLYTRAPEFDIEAKE